MSCNRMIYERNLAELQTESVLRGYWTGMWRGVIVISYILASHWLPVLLQVERDEACQFNAQKANNYFAFVLQSCLVLSDIIVINLIKCNLPKIKSEVINLKYVYAVDTVGLWFQGFILLVGQVAWFVWAQTMWGSYEKDVCSDGLRGLDMVNFIAISFYCLMFLILDLILLFYLPCVFDKYREKFAELREDGKSVTKTFLEAVVHMKMNTIAFEPHSLCAICKSNFNDSDVVTPLPCTVSHYFHESCVKGWLESHDECPVCQVEVAMDNLISFSNRVNEAISVESIQSDLE